MVQQLDAYLQYCTLHRLTHNQYVAQVCVLYIAHMFFLPDTTLEKRQLHAAKNPTLALAHKYFLVGCTVQ